jgi:hypothetical protein
VLIPSIHLAQAEKNYFIDYVQAAGLLAPTLNEIKQFQEQYKDASKKMVEAARTP